MASSSYWKNKINEKKREITSEETVIKEILSALGKDVNINIIVESGISSSDSDAPATEEVPLTGVVSGYLLDGKHDAELKEMGILRKGKKYYFDVNHDGVIDDTEKKSWMTRSGKKIVLQYSKKGKITVNSMAIYGDISKCDKTLFLAKVDTSSEKSRVNRYNSTSDANKLVFEIEACDKDGKIKSVTNNFVKGMDKYLKNIGINNKISHGIGTFSMSSTKLLEYINKNDTPYDDIYFAYPPNVHGVKIDWTRLSKYNIHICESESDVSGQGNNAIRTIYLGQGTLEKIFKNAKSVSITVPGNYASNSSSDSYALLDAARQFSKKYNTPYDEHIAEGASWKGHHAAQDAIRYGSAW